MPSLSPPIKEKGKKTKLRLFKKAETWCKFSPYNIVTEKWPHDKSSADLVEYKIAPKDTIVP